MIYRASYARGFRAPSLKELYFDFVDINHNIKGNKNLIAEQSNNYTLNITYKKRIKRKTLALDFGGFYKASKQSCEIIIKEYQKQFNLCG